MFYSALRVYCIPLHDSQFNGDHSAYLVMRISKNDLPGLVFDPRICGETVSCLIANSTHPPMYRILFLNIRSGKYLIVDVDAPHVSFPSIVQTSISHIGFLNWIALHIVAPLWLS